MIRNQNKTKYNSKKIHLNCILSVKPNILRKINKETNCNGNFGKHLAFATGGTHQFLWHTQRACRQVKIALGILVKSKELNYIFVVRYRVLLDSVLQNDGTDLVDTLKLFIEASKNWSKIVLFCYFHCFFLYSVVNEHVSLVISRQILTDVGNQLSRLPDETSKCVSHFALDKVQPRVISFEEQVASIRQHLAQIYERTQNWREAANVLVGIPLETGQKCVHKK